MSLFLPNLIGLPAKVVLVARFATETGMEQD